MEGLSRQCERKWKCPPLPFIVAELTPFFHQGSPGLARFERHQHCPERRVIYRDRVIEDDHHPVARLDANSFIHPMRQLNWATAYDFPAVADRLVLSAQ
jgi:hypothetical protein